MQRDGQAVRVAADVEFAREATARAPKTLSMSSPFRRRRSGAPGCWCCRSSAGGRPRRRHQPRLPASRPTGRTRSSAGTGGTPRSSGRVRLAGHATARRCGRSRRWRRAPAGGRGRACRRAGWLTPRKARRRTTPRPSVARGPTPISMPEISLESCPRLPGNPPPRPVCPRDLGETGCVGTDWSGRRDSNPRPQPWQGCALPLSYARTPSWGAPFTTLCVRCKPTGLRPRFSCTLCGRVGRQRRWGLSHARRRRSHGQPASDPDHTVRG